MPHLKPAPQAKAPGQEAFFSERLGMCFCLMSVQWGCQSSKNCLVNCFSLRGLKRARPPHLQSQIIKGCPLGGSHKNWGTRQKLGHTCKMSPLGDTAALEQDTREGKDGPCRGQGKRPRIWGWGGGETKIALKFRACQPPFPEHFPAGSWMCVKFDEFPSG